MEHIQAYRPCQNTTSGHCVHINQGGYLGRLTTKVHFGVMVLQMAPTKIEPTARTPKTMALAALEISGFAPPPAPMPLRAPKTPGSVKAVAATMKAAKMLERYQVTGC